LHTAKNAQFPGASEAISPSPGASEAMSPLLLSPLFFPLFFPKSIS